MNRKNTFINNTFLAVFIMFMLSCCGYQMVTEKGIFGGEISSLDVPLFKNKTYEPHASGYVTDAFSKELIATGLFKINKDNADGYIQGNIINIRIIPSSLSSQGIVIEKSIEMKLDLSLYKKTGAFIKKWMLTESEIYNVADINTEEYNKRDALARMSGRMARKFSSMLLVDY